MEYELFRSKLKPSIDGASISGIIRCSSSSLSSHRTAVMELIIEGSIQARRERMFAKGENSLQSDPTPQHKRTSEVQNIFVPEVQPPTPAPVPQPQPPSQSLPNGTAGTVATPKPAPFKYRAPEDLWAPPKPAKKSKKTVRREEPPADVKTNPSSSENFVGLACQNCGVRQLRSRLWDGVYCNPCPLWFGGTKMKCIGCNTIRVDDVGACTGCHRTFK